MKVSKKNLYPIEQQMVESYASNKLQNFNRLKRKKEDLISSHKDFAEKFIKSQFDTLDVCLNIKLSPSTLNIINSVHQSTLSNIINEKHIQLATEYSEKLFCCNLQNIKISQISNSHLLRAEGSCMPCGNDRHYCFYQDYNTGVVSTDLLVHELSHAADYTMNRKRSIDYVTIQHACLAEAIAYFGQLSYLKKHGDKNKRAGALGAFLFTYLCIVICRYMNNTKIELKNLNFDKFISNEETQVFVHSYSNPTTGINIIKKEFEKIKNGGPLLVSEIYQRYGIVLAICLIANNASPELIKRISVNNSIKTDLSDLLIDFNVHYPELDRYFNEYIS